MSLSDTEIELAYRLVLGRSASEQERATIAGQHETLGSLRDAFLRSGEFALKFRSLQAEVSQAMVPALVHLHIPKTAGSSLTQVLLDGAKHERRFTVGDNDIGRLEALSFPERRELQFIFGHLAHGVHDLLPQPVIYICVLREPGPRLLSYYRYIHRRTDHPLHDVVGGRGMSFGQFLEYAAETPTVRIEMDNGQMRCLAGNKSVSGLGQESALLPKALHNVFSPNLVYGLTEHFEHFMDHLTRRGFIEGYTPTVENAAPEPGQLDDVLRDLTETQLALFNAFNIWDAHLYEVCRSVYFAGSQSEIIQG
ncbi:sulfotransferase family 2 domain-containing protein [Aestuariibius sp. 2305UL40-4]|uniref:sulfotransferase family 2 domain-containing protein n=1 Tax=Aestuariibius violaceus TaxID=3234132 RepID=UPI00345F0804